VRNAANRSRHFQGSQKFARAGQRPTNQANPHNKAVAIFVADGHEVYRSGLRLLLESRRGWVVCGEATNGREALEQAEKLRPDVVILDASMPEPNGLDAAKAIMKNLPESQVLLMVAEESENQLKDVFAAGVRACVLKSDPARDLIGAVEAATNHMPVYSQRAIQVLLRTLGTEPGRKKKGFFEPVLSLREREVRQLLAEGKSSKEIAATLHVGLRTVETRRANIANKIRARSLVDLVQDALRKQIAKP
jgi:DNA-binding NarL/FixJ family response regulator